MSEHIVSPKIYVAVFLALMLLTAVTVTAAFVDLTFDLSGHEVNFNPMVALGIAGLKATLVILFFMHVKYSPKLTKLVVACGVFWLLILLSLTMMDYLSRPMLTSP